ncbi:MAG: hypothetical protein COB02_14735 [Candidatus Cloacimonadota bacterium]|nr:MAG: hypothetical protein COB02_14735 [Candidatus Cloacimonadota bacterium]
MNFGFKKALEIQSLLWLEAGIISSSQRDMILSLYPQSTLPSITKVFSFLGMLFFGLSLLLILANNWQYLGRTSQLLTVVFGLVTTYIIGINYYFKNKISLSEKWFFFSCFVYGVAIWLIAQIFHLNAHYPDGIWLWAIGVLPVLLFFRSRPFLYLYIFLVELWLVQQFYFSAELCLSFPIIHYFSYYIYKQTKKESANFLIVFSFGYFLWFEKLFYFWKETFSIKYFSYPFFIVHFSYFIITLLLLGLCLKKDKQELGNYFVQKLGKVYFALVFLLSFKSIARWIFRFHHYSSSYKIPEPIFFLVPAIVYLSIQCSIIYRYKYFSNSVKTLILSEITFLIFIFIRLFVSELNFDFIIFLVPIVVNLYLFYCGIQFIRYGLKLKLQQMFFNGVFLVLALAFCRYFDLFSSYLGGAITFGVSGFILHLAGKYWDEAKDKSC